ncbi:MAG: FGGY-family carbohydrate kinase [candidate division NC10 bacterium]
MPEGAGAARGRGRPGGRAGLTAARWPWAHGALPFLAGERSPGWRDDARGALSGIRLGTNAVGILGALLESVAYRLALVHERLAPLCAPGHAIVASGGALARSPSWTAMIASALGTPVTLSSEAEASIRGAALLTLQALGAPAPPPAPAGRLVMPDSRRHAIYQAAMERQRRLYETVVGPRLS